VTEEVKQRLGIPLKPNLNAFADPPVGVLQVWCQIYGLHMYASELSFIHLSFQYFLKCYVIGYSRPCPKNERSLINFLSGDCRQHGWGTPLSCFNLTS
jgi:hypothetical protein